MSRALTESQAAFSAEFDQFCRDHVAPYAAIHDRTGLIAPEVWAALRRYDYFRLFHARELGGRGADGTTMGLAIEILGRYCASTAYSANVSTCLYGKVAAEHMPPKLRQRWLSPVLTGEKIGCFMITEPDAPAADFHAHTTLVRKDGDKLLLSGRKAQVGNGPVADLALVYTGIESEGRRGKAFCLVDMRRAGVGVKRQPRNLALRAMPWAEVTFSDYALHPEEVLVSSLEDDGFSLWSAMKEVDWGKILVYMTSLGVARSALEAALEHVQHRICFGRSMKHLQGVQATLARMRYLFDAARPTAYWAIDSKTHGQPSEPALSAAKVFVTESAFEICRLALGVYGGYGVNAAEFPQLPVERYYRDSMAGIHAGITTLMAMDLLVCESLGENGFTGEPASWLADTGLRLELSAF